MVRAAARVWDIAYKSGTAQKIPRFDTSTRNPDRQYSCSSRNTTVQFQPVRSIRVSGCPLGPRAVTRGAGYRSGRMVCAIWDQSLALQPELGKFPDMGNDLPGSAVAIVKQIDDATVSA